MHVLEEQGKEKGKENSPGKVLENSPLHGWLSLEDIELIWSGLWHLAGFIEGTLWRSGFYREGPRARFCLEEKGGASQRLT